MELKRKNLSDLPQNFSKPVACYGYSVTIEHGRASITSYDPGCLKVTGYHPEEFAADPLLWYRIVHPDDREAVIEQSDAVLSSRSMKSVNYRIIHKDGRIRFVRNAIVLRCDANGRLVSYDGLVSVLSDESVKTNTLLNVQKYMPKPMGN